MKFEVSEAIEILRKTPATLDSMLHGLSPVWTHHSPAIDEWSAFDVIGHLIHGEKTDWIPRARLILVRSPDAVFETFDRFAQFTESDGKTIEDLLGEFSDLRNVNLQTLQAWNLTEPQMNLRGVHPELGSVTFSQLLATWVVHDLTHIRQIATILASRYKSQVGPWQAYLSIIKQ